ncbi:hypothetical protein SteCoe_30908 [Stentor coeruleus]|uniref:Uncharacterized protein n=1 Tax=Stentor coeruleus TaxID=5963 RepID=A0A1R2B2H0_9CILI|nr:hypothetical protein SteCoe_30908 [Stentor coeruleus]
MKYFTTLLLVSILIAQGLSTNDSLFLLQNDIPVCSEIDLAITCGAWDCSVKMVNEDFEAKVEKVTEETIEASVTDLLISEGDCEEWIVSVTCSDSNDCPVTASIVTVIVPFFSEITEILTFLVPLEYGIIS